MKFVIDIDDNLFTRLFDNGEELSKSDRKELETVVRNAKLLPQKKSHKEYSWNAEKIETTNDYEDGWNDCLDEILGETK